MVSDKYKELSSSLLPIKGRATCFNRLGWRAAVIHLGKFRSLAGTHARLEGQALARNTGPRCRQPWHLGRPNLKSTPLLLTQEQKMIHSLFKVLATLKVQLKSSLSIKPPSGLHTFCFPPCPGHDPGPPAPRAELSNPDFLTQKDALTPAHHTGSFSSRPSGRLHAGSGCPSHAAGLPTASTQPGTCFFFMVLPSWPWLRSHVLDLQKRALVLSQQLVLTGFRPLLATCRDCPHCDTGDTHAHSCPWGSSFSLRCGFLTWGGGRGAGLTGQKALA